MREGRLREAKKWIRQACAQTEFDLGGIRSCWDAARVDLQQKEIIEDFRPKKQSKGQ